MDLKDVRNKLNELREKYGIKDSNKIRRTEPKKLDDIDTSIWSAITNGISSDYLSVYIMKLPHPTPLNEQELIENLEYTLDFAKKSGLMLLAKRVRAILLAKLTGVPINIDELMKDNATIQQLGNGDETTELDPDSSDTVTSDEETVELDPDSSDIEEKEVINEVVEEFLNLTPEAQKQAISYIKKYIKGVTEEE